METLKTFLPESPKEEVINAVRAMLINAGYTIVDEDVTRPWGGFFRLADTDAPKFIQEYFANIRLPIVQEAATLSPKILIVEPGKQLSWQHHARRAEHWTVVTGPVGIKTSDTDEIPEAIQTKQTGDIVSIPQGQRHRLIGTNAYGLVAEIWEHTDPASPSDEQDIVRVADDFGR